MTLYPLGDHAYLLGHWLFIDLSLRLLLVRVLGIRLNSFMNVPPKVVTLNNIFNFPLQLKVVLGVVAMVLVESIVFELVA